MLTSDSFNINRLSENDLISSILNGIKQLLISIKRCFTSGSLSKLKDDILILINYLT